jgi:hypothetical protein
MLYNNTRLSACYLGTSVILKTLYTRQLREDARSLGWSFLFRAFLSVVSVISVFLFSFILSLYRTSVPLFLFSIILLSFACLFLLSSAVHISVTSPCFVSFLDSILSLSFHFSLFHNIIPKTAFGSKRKEAKKGHRLLRTLKIHDLYYTPIIVRMTKSRTTR